MPAERRHHPESPMIEGENWGIGGGFIAKTVSFSYPPGDYEGNLFLGKNAGIFDEVTMELVAGIKVTDYAVVYGKAKVGSGQHIKIYGNAKVYGESTIGYGGSEKHLTEVYDNAEIYQNAKVNECAKIYGNAKIYNEAYIYGHAKVFGDARVSGSAKIHGNVEISGNVCIHGNTEICGELKISGNTEIGGGIYFSEKEIEVTSKEELDRYECKNEEELNERQKVKVRVMEVSSSDGSKIHVVLKQREFGEGDKIRTTKKDDHGKYWEGIVKKVEEKTYAEWDGIVSGRLYLKDIKLVSRVDPLAEIEDLCIFFFSSLCASSVIVGQIGRFFS